MLKPFKIFETYFKLAFVLMVRVRMDHWVGERVFLMYLKMLVKLCQRLLTQSMELQTPLLLLLPIQMKMLNPVLLNH